ncbi:MAG: hypothetical protein KF862_10385 [Chitinophagaceae bacterium]|nr:hypothetical protein [Chitinophagaceae bacterium]
MAPIPAWLIRSIVVNVIKYKANVTLGRQLNKLQNQINDHQKTIDSKRKEISDILNPPGPDMGTKLNGGRFSGAGAGGSWGEKMTDKEIAEERKKADERFQERDPEGFKKAKELEKEIDNLNSNIDQLKEKQNKVMKAQDLLKQTNADQIAENIADGISTVFDAVREANKKVNEDVEKRRKEEDEKNK